MDAWTESVGNCGGYRVILAVFVRTVLFERMVIYMETKEEIVKIIEAESAKINYVRCQKERIYKTIEYAKEYDVIQKGMKILNIGGEVEGIFGRLWKASFPGVEFIPTKTDLHFDLPYDDNEFDGILCCEVFEHIGDLNFRSSTTNFSGVFHLLNEMTRVMKEGRAKAFITTPNVTSIHNLQHILRGSHPFMYPLHYREYSRYELEQIISYLGLEKILLESHMVFQQNKKLIKALMDYLVKNNLPVEDRGDDWFFIYQKPNGWKTKDLSGVKTALVVYPEMRREPEPEFRV